MADRSPCWPGSSTHRIAPPVIGTTMLAVVIALASPACAQVPCRYQIEAVFQGPPGPISISPTVPLSISPNGQWVVGYFNYDGVAAARGWYYQMPDGPFTPLPHPAGFYTSFANDVNDAGLICGHIGGSAGDFGFVFDLGTQQYTLLPPAYPGTCSATGINGDGIVCGTRTIATDNKTSGFTWSAATGFQDAGLIDGLSSGFMGINENNIPVGWRGSSALSANTLGVVGPLSSLLVLPPVPGGSTSTCWSVNSSGTICGFGRTPSPFGGYDNRAFVYDDGVPTSLGVLPGYRRSRAYDIANSEVVGGSCDTLELNGAFAPRGFVWHSGTMRDVTVMVEAASGQFIEISSVDGIAGTGRLACWGHVDGVSDLVIVLDPADITGDLDGNCFVNVNDLLAVVTNWGTSDSDGDADGDGFVDVDDLLLVIINWTF